MGSHHKKKKGTDDSRIIIADIKKDTDQDAIRTVLQTGLEMITGGGPNIPPARATIDFVNVTETIDPAQSAGGAGDVIPPAQVTGLTATAASSSQINLNWTANSEPDLNHYDVYRSTINGFTVTLGVTVPVGSPSVNSYPDTGLSASTTYYYKVGAVDNSSNRGAVSVQASAITQSPGSIPATMFLSLNNNLADSSTNAVPVTHWTGVPPVQTNSPTFATPGKFGSHYIKFNDPTNIDEGLISAPIASYPQLNLDFTVGFSFSMWIRPTVIPASGGRIFATLDDLGTTPGWAQLAINSTQFDFVVKLRDGAIQPSRKHLTAVSINTWYHIVVTFNAVTNVSEIYVDKIAGVAASAIPSAPVYQDITIGNMFGGGHAFRGGIDEFQFFNGVVLTQTQVNNLFATNAP